MNAPRIVGFVIASLAVLAFAAPATAQLDATVVVASDEAWYQPNPGCGSPAGCVDTNVPGVSMPAPTTYPEGSLHVAVTQGQETARTYMSFALAPSAAGHDALLEVPIDTAGGSGTLAPDVASIAVCTFYGVVTDEEGSLDPPPVASCATSAALEYDPDGGRLVADVTDLMGVVVSGGGLVLLPNASELSLDATWHVAFSASDRTDAPTAPASLTLTGRATASSTIPDPERSTPTRQGAINPIAPVAPRLAPAVPFPSSPASTPPISPPQSPVPAAADAQRIVTSGYAYPWAVRVPFALALLLVLAGRALTGELAARPARPTVSARRRSPGG